MNGDGPVLEGYPLSPQQERLWPEQQASPALRAQGALRLAGSLDPRALRAAVQRVIDRHEILRTSFAQLPGMGRPLQVIAERSAADWAEVDLGRLCPCRQREIVEALFESELRRPFDPARPPLVRSALLRLGRGEHVLLLSLPALCADARSLAGLCQEISAACVPGTEGEPPPVQYVDFAQWRQGLLTEADARPALEHWRRQGTVAASSPALPGETTAPAGGAPFLPAAVPLADGLAARLAAAACREASDEVLLLAGFLGLLRRLTGAPEIAVHVRLDGRKFPELETACGLFEHYPPVAVRLADDPPLASLVERTGRALDEARACDECFAAEPGELPGLACETAEPFAFEPAGGLELSLLRSHCCTRRFRLKLCAGPGPAASLLYDPGLYDPADVARLAGQLAALAAAAFARPGARLDELEVLTEAERRELLAERNRTARPLPAEDCLHRLFEAQAARTPDAVAVAVGGEALTYRELDRLANRLAHRLRRHGAGLESPVVLCLGRSTGMVTALLAVWKCGGFYVPIDAGQPRHRLERMLATAGAALVVSESRLRPVFAGLAVTVLELDGPSAGPECPEWDTPPAVDPLPGHLAYMIFTSGSTGEPKATMICHRSAVNLAFALTLRIYREHPSPLRIGLNAPLAFDASVKQVVQLLTGHCLHVVPEEVRRDGEALLGLLVEQGLEVLDCTPAQLRLLLAAGLRPGVCPALRIVLVGGEEIDAVLWRSLAAFRDVRFVNLYGPTECTVDATACTVAEAQEPSLGPPLANVRAYLLDGNLRPVPTGVDGELYVGGLGLARGYRGQPGLTAERFLPDLLSGLPGARLYRTGDLARHPTARSGASGLEFVGRADLQVKVRGFRVELGEIEAVLRCYPGVREAAVLSRAETAGGLQLVAYVATADAAVLPEGTLLAFLGDRLPEYMVPHSFVSLPALPLTRNGKIDRAALARQAPVASRDDRAGRELPRTQIEELLAGQWAEVLGYERVGTEADFFVLGGHSLLATQLISRLRQALCVEIPLRSLFDHPTVSGLAAAVEAALRSPDSLAAPPVTPVPRDSPLPLSFAQQRLWFLDRMVPGNPFYNVPLAARLSGRLDPGALARVLSEIVRRHEVLRTRFVAVEGEPRQVIDPPSPFLLPVADLSGLPRESREEELLRLARDEAARPIDLERGPLLRGMLLRLEEEEHAALLSTHHIASDGWSLGILLAEVAALYRGFRAGLPSPLPELPVQYADFAGWQRRWLAGEVLERQLETWRRRLAGAPAALALPTDRGRPAVRRYRGARRPVVLGEPFTGALHALCRSEKVSLFMALLAAFAALLGRAAGQLDVCIGTPIAGRNRLETEGLIGFFVNTLVLRTDLSGAPGLRELLRRVREVALEAHAHQDLPFEKLVEELKPGRDLGRSPLFQAMLVVQNTPREEQAVPGLALRSLDLDNETAKFDLTLTLGDSDGGIGGALAYDHDLFEATTAGRLVSQLTALLTRALADPAVPLFDLDLLADEERRQLLAESGWRAAGPETAAGASVPELFAAAARRRSEAPAIDAGGERLSYGEAAARVNRLARWLLRLGVGPEVVVGICLDRPADRVVALLAVLAAGGAYVPLDADHPSERLRALLTASRARLLLTGEALAGRFAGFTDFDGAPARIVRLDAERDAIAAESAAPVDAGVLPEQAAYVIFTSGSTGAPKGVVVEHRQLSAYVRGVGERLALPAGASYATLSTFAADLGHTAIFPALCSGGRLGLPAAGEALDAEALAGRFARSPADCLKIVPSHLRALLHAAGAPERLLPRHLLVLGGEPSGWDLIGEIRRLAPGCEILNHYGPTETTVGVLTHRLAEDEPRGAAVPLGRPIPGARVGLFDAALRPVPPGVVGELFVGGDGVSRGYAHRPDLTAERFVPDPFGDLAGQPGARLYRTGDLARLLPSGDLEFLGRADQQVKLRGFRIEPGEIEAALRAHPAVSEAAVLLDGGGDEARLVAYAVPVPGETLATTELRRWLAERLPEPMVPGTFMPLGRLPLSANGKLDRSALPVPAGTAAPDARVAPRSLLELELCRLWQDLLGVEGVGVRDDFFALGGHSLLAVRLQARVERVLGRRFELPQLFRQPTVEHLAAVLRRQGGAPHPSCLVELAAGGPGRPFFWIHPAGGDVLCYAPLARHLGRQTGNGRPLYGLQSPSLFDDRAAAPTLAEMAAAYVANVRAVDPDGPYLLGGWSLGGVVAFEMARQLVAEGSRVALLALLDSQVPAPAAGPPSDAELLLTFAAELDSRGGELARTLEPELRGLDFSAGLARLAEQARAADLFPPDVEVAEVRRLLETHRRNVRARESYVPGSYPGQIVYFRAAERGGSQDLTRGWEKLAAGVEIHETPGDHLDMVREPGVSELAARLAACCEAAGA